MVRVFRISNCLIRFFIRESPFAMKYGFHYLCIANLQIVGEFHSYGDCGAILFWKKTELSFGQLARQHGDTELIEVPCKKATQSFSIHIRINVDKTSYIGD